MSPLDLIGTDPAHAVSFNERTADLGALGLGTLGMAQALEIGTWAIRETKYEAYGLSPEQRRAWVESLSFAATLLAAVPIVNALAVSRNMLTGLMTGDWLFVAFDMAMVTLSFALGWAARKAARVTPKAVRGTRRKNKELTAA